MQRIADQLAELRDRARRNNMRFQELQAEERFQLDRMEELRTQLVLQGSEDEPDDAEVERVRKELKKCQDRARAFRRAGEHLEREYQQLVTQEGADLMPQVE